MGLKINSLLRCAKKLIDEVALVSEEEIYHAMQMLYYEERIVAEGSCVVGLAAMKAGRVDIPDGPVAAIITGRNVNMDMFTKIMQGADITLGDIALQRSLGC